MVTEHGGLIPASRTVHYASPLGLSSLHKLRLGESIFGDERVGGRCMKGCMVLKDCTYTWG